MRKKKNHTKQRLFFFLILAGFFILIALFARQLCPYDPNHQNYDIAIQPPSIQHPFGTDRYGRDMLSRVIMGARTSIFSSLFLVTIVSVIGTAIGIVCAYNQNYIDFVFMRLADICLAFPGLVLALAVASVLNGGIQNAVFSLAVISWPKYARLVRSRMMVLKKEEYIKAAILAGNTPVQMIFRHILPNIAGQIFITAAMDIGTMMLEIAGLSFLGLGAKPPMAEWGSMMSDGRSMIKTYPWIVLSPGIGIFLSVMVFNLLGDALRDYIDPNHISESEYKEDR